MVCSFVATELSSFRPSSFTPSIERKLCYTVCVCADSLAVRPVQEDRQHVQVPAAAAAAVAVRRAAVAVRVRVRHRLPPPPVAAGGRRKKKKRLPSETAAARSSGAAERRRRRGGSVAGVAALRPWLLSGPGRPARAARPRAG